MSVIQLSGGGGSCTSESSVGGLRISALALHPGFLGWQDGGLASVFVFVFVVVLYFYVFPDLKRSPELLIPSAPHLALFSISSVVLWIYWVCPQPTSSSPDGAFSLRHPGVQNAGGFLWSGLLSYLPLGISPVLQTRQNLGCPVFTALQAETVLVIIELNWTHLAVVSVWCGTHGKRRLSGEALA